MSYSRKRKTSLSSQEIEIVAWWWRRDENIHRFGAREFTHVPFITKLWNEHRLDLDSDQSRQERKIKTRNIQV